MNAGTYGTHAALDAAARRHRARDRPRPRRLRRRAEGDGLAGSRPTAIRLPRLDAERIALLRVARAWRPRRSARQHRRRPDRRVRHLAGLVRRDDRAAARRRLAARQRAARRCSTRCRPACRAGSTGWRRRAGSSVAGRRRPRRPPGGHRVADARRSRAVARRQRPPTGAVVQQHFAKDLTATDIAALQRVLGKITAGLTGLARVGARSLHPADSSATGSPVHRPCQEPP